MRLRTLIGVAVVISLVSAGRPTPATGEPDSAIGKNAPAVIIFSGGTYHMVSNIEKKDDLVVYTKLDETPRAIPEYKVDWRRTALVNQALLELAQVCGTDRTDVGWIELLDLNSESVFRDIANRTMPGCLDALHDRQRRAEEAALERARRENMAGLHDADTSETFTRDDKVVVTNRGVATTARTIDGYPPDSRERYDHEAEYRDSAHTTISEECRKKATKGGTEYSDCTERQLDALRSLQNRTPGRTPSVVFLDIRDLCRRKWPTDYRRRDICEADNVDAFHVIEALMTDRRHDPADLDRIRSYCERTWPAEYTMQEGCMDDRLQAPGR